ncbi:DNA polymerase III, subunit gamma and tau [bacterium]|nr:DNA polymerase III, subunit gamma and tau [bacterium]|tara:strand:+ start:5438 stop:6472 length:1035 start_codon:yes stop_codon:yes gene_type:complete
MTEQLALYRKYRPESFKEVRDQDHIVSVLEGAIKKRAVPHAMIFSGTRGTGKTTMARIVARELGVADVDLYEIDAASNRGIDDVRELKEAVHTLPYQSEKKVYIIDEVHMLTKEAFNALLKTIEEPPEHVVFMMATTEIDKVLDTILSRCQVFTLHSPSRSVLAKTVTDVAKKEGFTLKPDAADMIAIAADGSFRDALGVLQKVILASGDKIGDGDEVAAIIGAPKTAALESLVQALHEKDAATALKAIADAAESQTDMVLFTRLLLERLRAVMLLRNAPNDAERILAQLPPSGAEQVEKLAADAASPLNSHLLLRALEISQLVRRASVPHLPLEVLVVEVCTK